MNKLTLTLVTASTLLSAPAFARHDSEWDYARVVRSEPIVRQVRVSEPRQECYEEPVTERTVYRGGYNNPGAPLIGAIIGGVIGHQFGQGHRDGHLATAAGAFIGANHAAANSGYRNDRVVERTVYETNCRTVRNARYEERIEGYNVTYKYRGRLHHMRMPYDPGRKVRIRVNVEPVDDEYDDRPYRRHGS